MPRNEKNESVNLTALELGEALMERPEWPASELPESATVEALEALDEVGFVVFRPARKGPEYIWRSLRWRKFPSHPLSQEDLYFCGARGGVRECLDPANGNGWRVQITDRGRQELPMIRRLLTPFAE